MKDQIEQALMPLLGEPLSDMWRWRYCYQGFEFGPQRGTVNSKGHSIMQADFRLHVACEWHVYHLRDAVLGSDCYGQGAERREPEAAQPFFRHVEAASLVVESLSATENGDVSLQFSEQYALEILARNSFATAEWYRPLYPSDYATQPSVADEPTEYWRLLFPNHHHWVFTSAGLKEWRDDRYFAAMSWLSDQTAAELKTAKSDPVELRQALCRYYKRGYQADLNTGELMIALGIDHPDIFEMAGYTEEEGDAAMDVSDSLTEDEIEHTDISAASS